MKSDHQTILPHEHILLSVVPGAMIMPGASSYIVLDEDESSKNILEIVRNSQSISFFIVMTNPRIKDLPDRFYKIGMIAEAKADPKDPVIFLEAVSRAQMLTLKRIGESGKGVWVVTVKSIEDENYDDYFIEDHQQIMANMIKTRDLLVSFMNRSRGFYNFDNRLMRMIVGNFENIDWGDKDAVDYFVWGALSSVPDLLQNDKQPFLESTSLPERINLLVKKLKERLKLLEIQRQGSLKDERGQGPKEMLKVPVVDEKDQVNDQDDFVKGAHVDVKKQWERFKVIRDFMNEDAKKVVMEDIKRLMSFGSPHGNTYEWPKFMGRLEFILDLPWKDETPQESDISKVVGVLDEDHYGLTYVKDAICDQLAPKLLNPEGKGYILCLVGPPGVGKTSLAKSVARALNRKYIRMSLGGVRDEAQIRGHKITYIGSEPGEILKEMKRCGVRNPVFVIDEIDKLGNMSTSGDPSSAMLEVFDPEQNNSFKDHYVACGFDLSKVMFIATANIASDIIPPLRDRMDIITLPGYLEVEKIEIARRYLVARWMKETGLTQNGVEVQLEEGLMSDLIRGYTGEAGVRNLERTIATMLRKVSREYLKSKGEAKPLTHFTINHDRMHEFLGPPKFFKDRVRATMVGEAIGLAWTPVGGDILYVQAEMYPMLPDKKVLARTGMQGNVMKESDEVAMTIVKNTNPEFLKKLSENAIHLHIPEGAIPKDGPSAGVTIVSALCSELMNRPLKPNLAMTGEIDLKRNVLPVGGIREKIVAAERAGIEEIIMPKENERNLYDVPKEVKDKLKFHFVETIDQVLAIAFP